MRVLFSFRHRLWSLLGWLSHNRRRRRAQKRRQFADREMRFESLEPRVVLDADAVDDEILVEPSAFNTADYAPSLDNDADDSGPIGVRYEANPQQDVTLGSGDSYSWSYAISDGLGGYDQAKVALTATGDSDAAVKPFVYVENAVVREQDGSITVNVRLSHAYNQAIIVHWSASNGSAHVFEDWGPTWHEGYEAEEWIDTHDEQVWIDGHYEPEIDSYDPGEYNVGDTIDVLDENGDPATFTVPEDWDGNVTTYAWVEGHDERQTIEGHYGPVWHDGYYDAYDGDLWFTAGDTERQLTFDAIDDPDEEGDEAFEITLNQFAWWATYFPANTPQLNTWSNGTVVILDNDRYLEPVAVDDARTIDEDTEIDDGDVSTNDVDFNGSPLTYELIQDVEHGVLTFNTDGTFIYVPQANFNGVDSFQYRANNDQYASNLATVTITIDSVNDVPTAQPGSIDVLRGGTIQFNSADLYALLAVTNPDGGDWAVSFSGNFTYGWLTYDSLTDTYSYYAGATAGDDPYTFTFTDSSEDSVSVDLTVRVTDAPPIVEDASPTIEEDTTLTVGGTDPEGDPLTAVIVTAPDHGTLTPNADGTMTYTPDADYNGDDSFQYLVNDGSADSNVATVSITIMPVNDAPAASAGSTTVARSGTKDFTTADLFEWLGVHDVEGDSVSVTSWSGYSWGSLSYYPSTDTYTFTAYGYPADDPIIFTFTDSHGASTDAILTVRILNAAPVVEDHSFTVDEDTQLTNYVTGADVDGDGLSYETVAAPTHGTIQWYGGGWFNYVPDGDYAGDDSFTFRAFDGYEYSNTATVGITIVPVNDAPSFTAGGDVVVTANSGTYSAVWASGISLGPANESSQVPTFVVSSDASALFAEDGQPIIAADGTLTFTTAANAYGSAVVTVYLSDDGGTERGGVDQSPVATFTITILSQPVLTFDDVVVHEIDGTATITFHLDSADHQGVTFDFATADGSAVSPDDYGAATGTVSFAAGETEKTVSIGIVNDTVDEDDEAFTVAVSNIVGATAPDGDSIVTILNSPAPVLTVDDVVVRETDGAATITFHLSSGDHGNVSFDFATADGSAVDPSDYGAASGTVSFAAGETEKTVSITIVNDTVDEDDEAFSVVVNNVVGAKTTVEAVAVTILDNPVLTMDDVVVRETDGWATITFHLDSGDHQGVSFDFTTVDGSAVDPSDYGAASGTVTFAAGETEKTVSIGIVNDTIDEDDETFTVVTSNLSSASAPVGASTVTIIDNPVLTMDDVVVHETDGTATITFHLSGGDHQGVSFDFATVDGSAVASSDYAAAMGTLFFAAGQTEQTVSIAIVGDSEHEDDESFTVVTSNLSGASAPVGASTVTILGDPAVTVDDVTVDEGAGTATVTFHLSRGDHLGVLFNYTTADGSALNAYDYGGVSSSISFDIGETEKTATFSIVDDGLDEQTLETFLVQVYNVSGAGVADGEGVVSIHDNDLPTALPFTAPPTIEEGDATELTGTIMFADPTWGLYEYEIEWGDDSTTTGTLQPGETAFQATHVYEDDDPTETSSDMYTITVTVKNPDEETGVGYAFVTVNNVAPEVEILNPEVEVYEGSDIVEIRAVATDKSAKDELTAVVYVNGVEVARQSVTSGVEFSFYFDPSDDDPEGDGDFLDGGVGVFDFEIVVLDDDGGESAGASGSITVNNVAPSATPLVDYGEVAVPPSLATIETDIRATIVDPGTDLFILTFPQEIPAEQGLNTFLVVVTDDDGDITVVAVQYTIT